MAHVPNDCTPQGNESGEGSREQVVHRMDEGAGVVEFGKMKLGGTTSLSTTA